MQISELNNYYKNAESHYQKLFSEQRNNILISFGDHWQSKHSKSLRQVANKTNKLRITKNHIGRIVRKIQNEILRHSPDVGIVARNENELSDQKAAEISESIWSDIKETNKFKKLKRELVKDFVEIGEACVKVSFDPHRGTFLGYQIDEDENKHPIFDGQISFERILGFNLLWDPNADSDENARWCCLRKMASRKSLKSMLPIGDKRLKYLEETSSSKKLYKVFNPVSTNYSDSDDLLVREFYFRPSFEYPKGYYFITTESGILFEGELPFGIWPIQFVTYNSLTTSPRGYSLIRDLRPCQVEINRCASKIAEHQITLGDDKALIQRGSYFAVGKSQSGVKSMEYSGAKPEVIPGRSGMQYFDYLNSQITELYQIANVHEEDIQISNQANPYLTLFQSVRDRKKFSLFAEKFEEFLGEICLCSLQHAKRYYSQEKIVPTVGKPEAINIAEFKRSDALKYQIKRLPQSDDIESKMGQQLSLNHLMQYGASHLDKEDIGLIIRNMPYANSEQLFQGLTSKYDAATADILAMERGVERIARENDDDLYFINRFTQRTKQLDFEQLDPYIQNLFHRRISQHEQQYAVKSQAEANLKIGNIPTSGGLVGVDFYAQDENGGRSKRLKLPHDAIAWLSQKLEQQGLSENDLNNLDAIEKLKISEKILEDQHGYGEPARGDDFIN